MMRWNYATSISRVR